MLSLVEEPREEKVEELGATLDEIAREGARRMLIQALEEEVAAYVDAHDERDASGRRLVVRNGKARPRESHVGDRDGRNPGPPGQRPPGR